MTFILRSLFSLIVITGIICTIPGLAIAIMALVLVALLGAMSCLVVIGVRHIPSAINNASS